MTTNKQRSDNAGSGLQEADFMRLLMQHEPVLRAFARSLLPHWHLVDEVIQDASITIWEKWDQLRDPGGFLPWAKVIVRFKCQSAIARLRRQQMVVSEEVWDLLAEEADAIEVDEQQAIREALRSCLQRVSAAHQELLLAPYAGPGSVKTLAEARGKSANALYKLLGRLREKLAQCIQNRLRLETP